jgi:acyl carrier protein
VNVRTAVHLDSNGTGNAGDTMPQKQQIKAFILQNFLFSDDPSAVGDQDSLIQGGIIDSTGIHELVFFLEDAFKLQIAAEEMTPANFDSIQTVDAFVSRKLAVAV